MKETIGPFDAAFDALTDKQREVLALLADGRTTKEMAPLLGVSEPAINRRIEMIRARLGGITRLELARRYRDWQTLDQLVPLHIMEIPPLPGVENTSQTLHLAGTQPAALETTPDLRGPDAVFRDSVSLHFTAPWHHSEEPRIVPGVLDGDNASFTRGAAIAIILIGILASIVLGLAAAQAITAVVSN